MAASRNRMTDTGYKEERCVITKCSFWSLQGLRSFMQHGLAPPFSPFLALIGGVLDKKNASLSREGNHADLGLWSGETPRLHNEARWIGKIFTDMELPSTPEPWKPKPSWKPPTPLPCPHQEAKHFHESPQAPIVYVIYDLGAFSFQGIGP